MRSRGEEIEEAKIDEAYARAFGVGKMPDSSREWFALGYRAALARPANDDAKVCPTCGGSWDFPIPVESFPVVECPDPCHKATGGKGEG